MGAPVLARSLVFASAAIMFALGTLHLVLTFAGGKLLPRDPAVRIAMESSQLALSAQTTVWNAWIGFNASHSLGAILFGLAFGYFAAAQPELLFRSVYLQVLGVAVLVAFVALARLYWFSIPLLGVSLALACFVAGAVAARLASATS
jgi:hypothetical protein